MNEFKIVECPKCGADIECYVEDDTAVCESCGIMVNISPDGNGDYIVEIE